MEKNMNGAGVDSVEHGFAEEPVLDPVAEIEAESFTVSPAELRSDMKEAGVKTPETSAESTGPVPTGIDQVETGFADRPDPDVLAAASASAAVSPAELTETLNAVGVEVPEKAPKEKASAAPVSGVDQVEAGFTDRPDPDVLAAAFTSGTVTPAELAENLHAVGVKVPEKPAREATPAAPVSGVDQVETGFRAESPLDVLSAASMSSVTSPKERAANLKSVGVTFPEPPVRESSGPTGVESIHAGFTSDPELNTVEEISATRYAAAPQETEKNIEKMEKERLGERIPVGEVLLQKLQEGGYTGDLDDLRKLFDDLKRG